MTKSTRASQARSQDTRQSEARTREWIPPQQLDTPEPRPGYRQKWVRSELVGDPDPSNLTKRFREGWAPRAIDTVPDSFHTLVTKDGATADGVISVRGLVLCEMPEHMVEQRNEHYQGLLDEQTQAIDEDLNRVEMPGHPIHRDRKTDVVRGKAPRAVRVADDPLGHQPPAAEG